MRLEYKTGKLPYNFIALGYMLLAISAWRIAVSDWVGMLLLLLSVFLLFFRSGIIVETDPRRLKMYYGIFFIKRGAWENIDQLTDLRITKVRQSRRMSVLTISRTESYNTYKLFLRLPNRSIELIAGQKDDILRKASSMASALNTTLVNSAE
ncbi:hypothetical protein [uncultured Acetobacteroides sp.]|uniref:hypothetical protein n=1 Tax=uncultured Acetobacteroides sp. TaxID=1760811 RepID=UPI0029F5936C|nr:hypothetical protein [uncultured Acetobacteroides sp.]